MQHHFVRSAANIAALSENVAKYPKESISLRSQQLELSCPIFHSILPHIFYLFIKFYKKKFKYFKHLFVIKKFVEKVFKIRKNVKMLSKSLAKKCLLIFKQKQFTAYLYFLCVCREQKHNTIYMYVLRPMEVFTTDEQLTVNNRKFTEER